METKQVKPLHYRSKENWQLEKSDMTMPSKEIVTVPGESFTILELIQRTQQGLPLVGNAKEPVWNDTEDFDSPDLDEISRLDVVDRANTLSGLKQRSDAAIEQYQNDVKASEASRKAEAIARKKAKEAKEAKED